MLRLDAGLLALAMVTSCWGMSSVVDTLRMHNQTQFAELIEEAVSQNLLDLSTGGPYTILVPTDDAFSQLSPGELGDLVSTGDSLADLLKYHVLQGEEFSWGLTNNHFLTTVSGHQLRVFVSGQSKAINDAHVGLADVEATNAVIHFIDRVLDVPLGSVYHCLREYNLTTYADYVDRTNLRSTLDRIDGHTYTVFAPSNAAFDRLNSLVHERIRTSRTYLRELVTYHIHMGTLHVASLDRNATISTMDSYHEISVHVDTDIHFNNVAYLELTDIDCDNGVVHILDHVLIPSSLGPVIG